MLRRIFCKLLFVAIVIFSLLALSTTVFAQGRSEEAFEHVKEVQERNALKLIAKPGVVGTAIGLNEKGRHIILIFLEKPGVTGIPNELEGVPVKQKVSGKIYALKPPTNRPPRPPRSLTATALSESEIYLDWRDNRESDIFYNVYRLDPGFPDYGLIASGILISEYYDNVGLLPGTTYYYVVTAESTAGESNYSNEASATTGGGVLNPPDAPTGLTATAMSSSQIDLSWADNANNETDYKIERKSGVSLFSEIDSVGANQTSYSDTGLDPSTMYTYRVCAYNSDGNSDYSNDASATTQDVPVDTTPPAPPSGLSATTVSSSQITLDWNDNSEPDLSGYNVYRSLTTGGPYIYVDSVGISNYSNMGLDPDTPYYYVVTAIDASDNESGYSNEDSATTQSGTEPVVNRQGWCSRPVPIGVSTGHPAITAGTIACRLKDISGNVFALSNNHVYAAENQASIGDNALQPGTYDGGAEGSNPSIIDGDEIGTLTAFVPVIFYPFGLNTIDAAIVECSEATLGNSTPDDGYGIPNSTTTGAYIGQAVQKYGRTTGLTKGTVTAVNGAFFVQYSTGFAIFMDQIVVEGNIESFSGPGDSGSLVVTDNLSCNPVGLLFAGSSSQTIINPIDAVLGAFSGVSIDGESK